MLLSPPSGDQAVYLQLDFTFPIELANEYPEVTLTARVNAVELGRQKYDRVGRYVFSQYVPAHALKTNPAKVEFELDNAARNPFHGPATGVIAMSAELVEYEQTAVYRDKEIVATRKAFEKLYQQKNVELPMEKYQEFGKRFYALPVWQSLRFMNVPIIKNPLDLWMMQQLFFEVQPEFVVETGTWYGGSALLWAYNLNALDLHNAKVLTIDVGDHTQHVSAQPLWKEYVEFFHGSSTDPAIVKKIQERVRGHKTLIVLDSDHSMGHVLRELQMYSPMVSSGSYIVVEDTHFDTMPTHPEGGPGPYAAVRRFLESGGNRDFDVDISREPFVFSFNSGGWLRRK